MKKFISLLIVIVFVGFISGCSSSKSFKFKDGSEKVCEPYGLFDEDTVKDNRVKYKIVTSNLIWGIILIETIFVPIIIVGHYLYEPVVEK